MRCDDFAYGLAAEGASQFQPTTFAAADREFIAGEEVMNQQRLLLLVLLVLSYTSLFAQQLAEPAAPRTITLNEAVDLALKHNHGVRIATLHVEEEKHAKEKAWSAYLPTIRNDSEFLHVTDTQFIDIPAGALGNGVPTQALVLNQGGKNFTTSGTGLTQPITELFKIKSANDVARADLNASREQARAVENAVALKVRQLYYKVLVVQSQHQAIESKIRAVEDLQSERVQQVKYGSTLEVDLIESRAQTLQAKQELLTTELQLSDLRMQFNDVVGLPLRTEVTLDSTVAPLPDPCEREQCMRIALDAHPEITEARAIVEKASAGVREAKREYIPDVEAFARYSYSNDVPFLARNFGTFGVHFSYDLFDGGKKRSTLHIRDAQLAQAKENLARISDEVELKVQTAYNKLRRTQQMVAVSQELLATRQEARRISAQQLEQGTYLRSQAAVATAQEFEAQTLLLQSQLDYAQAQDELTQAIGRAAR
jgi:outer membrane protein TolC